MTQQLYHNYRDPDSTRLFNERFRGIFDAGVYLGFNVSVGGSGGWYLKFTHNTDPDISGNLLGIVLTHSGVIIQENANQDDVMVGSGDAANNIHYIVASYIYNSSLPNNIAQYIVKKGTAAATPTPPTLSANEVKLAEIWVPGGATTYSDTGVRITNVARKDLYENNQIYLDFTGILKPGVYEGMIAAQGSIDLDVTLGAGTWITKEHWRIEEVSALTDFAVLTNPGTGLYKLAWIVAAHKYEDTNPIPDVDYLLVEGSPVAIGSAASLPSDGDIVTAAEVVSSKYDSIDYCNILGYIRLENRGGVYYKDYYLGETYLEEDSLIVYGAEESALSRSGKYFGHQGLLTAIEDVYTKLVDRTDTDRPYTIFLDGTFKMGGTPIRLPSHVKLQGIGATPQIKDDTSDLLKIEGFVASYFPSNNTVAQDAGTGTLSGYVPIIFTIEAAYQSGDNLTTRKFCYGDRIQAFSTATGNTYKGFIKDATTGSWAVEVWIETQYSTDGEPLDLDLVILKQDAHIENLALSNISTGDAALELDHVELCSLKDSNIRTFNKGYTENCLFENVEILDGILWDGASDVLSNSRYNIYNEVLVRVPAATVNVGVSEEHCSGSGFSYQNTTQVLDFDLSFLHSTFQKVILLGDSGSSLRIMNAVNLNIVFASSSNDLEFSSSTNSNIIAANIVGSLTNPTDSNRVFTSNLTVVSTGDLIEHHNYDRNITMYSDGNVSWDVVSGNLILGFEVYLDNPWGTGSTQIAAGTHVLDIDGDTLYVDIDRYATTPSIKTAAVMNKSGFSANLYKDDRIFIATRHGQNIYLWNGTRIESGQSIPIGSTPPPDGSVTYPKLANSALVPWEHFFRSYVSPQREAWDNENDLVFRNIDSRTMSYTSSTGWIQYSASVDIGDAVAGDVLLLRNQTNDPGGAYQGWNREQLLEVDDYNNKVRIVKGLTLNLGVGHLLNGAIARGNKIVTNDDLTTMTYSHTTGRITWAGVGLGFSSGLVDIGYVFVDSVGNKFMITDADSSGAGKWVKIGIGLFDVLPMLNATDLVIPTTKYHGSLETNNNPHNIPLADLRVCTGAEYIPIDGPGQVITDVPTLASKRTDTFMNTRYSTCRASIPYDPRIRVWTASAINGLNRTLDDNTKNYDMYRSLGAVEFTGVCTGVSIVAPYLSNCTILLDGSQYNGSNQMLTSVTPIDVDNVFDLIHNDYRLSSTEEDVTIIIRLPLGVHNIYVTGGCKGFYVINSPNKDDTTPYINRAPGTAINHGGELNLSKDYLTSLPANPEGWDKGGRLIRYIDNSGTEQWAERWVKGFADVGDANSGSNLITNVQHPEYWQVGDLMMVVGPTQHKKSIRRIVTILGSTITLDNNIVGITQSSIPLNYYGTSLTETTNTPDRNSNRFEEEVAQVLSVLDFCGGGELKNSNATAFESGVARTLSSIGVRCSDCNTGLASTVATLGQADGGAIELDATGENLRVYFTGTGISLNCERSGIGNLGLTIDGAAIPGIDSLIVDDFGGLGIARNLPYGTHQLIVEGLTGATWAISGFTIWQPKKPNIPEGCLELWDSNILGESDTDLLGGGVDLTDGVDEMQIGTINYDLAGIIKFTGLTGTMLDGIQGANFNYAPTNRFVQFSDGSNTITATIDIPFYGSEITILTSNITVNSSTILVKLLDYDGRYKAIGSTTGFISSSTIPGSLFNALSNIRCERHRISFSTLAYHIVRFEFQANNQDLIIAGAEVKQPFHNHKSKQPRWLDHWLPLQNGGQDVRNLIPFRGDLVPVGQSIYQAGRTFNISQVSQDLQQPFWFYSHGGVTTLKWSTQALITAANSVSLSTVVDGVDLGDTIQDGGYATGDPVCLSRIATFVLDPGFHFAYVHGTGAVLIKNTQWAVTEVVPQGNQLASRGQGVPMLGPSNPSESSY